MKKLSIVTVAALCSSAFAGPRTPVADFFAKHVDTSIPELSSIPELQGWKPLWINGPHKDQPIPTVAVEGGFSNATRIATVLYPYDGNNCPLRGIRASANPAATAISLLFADGSERTIDEAADPPPPQNFLGQVGR